MNIDDKFLLQGNQFVTEFMQNWKQVYLTFLIQKLEHYEK